MAETLDEARQEIERLKARIAADNKAYGCELLDPNGTIWEHATALSGLLVEAHEIIVERGESTDVPLQFRQHAWLKKVEPYIAAIAHADKTAQLR